MDFCEVVADAVHAHRPVNNDRITNRDLCIGIHERKVEQVGFGLAITNSCFFAIVLMR
jgi:hypothetical protein